VTQLAKIDSLAIELSRSSPITHSLSPFSITVNKEWLRFRWIMAHRVIRYVTSAILAILRSGRTEWHVSMAWITTWVLWVYGVRSVEPWWSTRNPMTSDVAELRKVWRPDRQASASPAASSDSCKRISNTHWKLPYLTRIKRYCVVYKIFDVHKQTLGNERRFSSEDQNVFSVRIEISL